MGCGGSWLAPYSFNYKKEIHMPCQVKLSPWEEEQEERKEIASELSDILGFLYDKTKKDKPAWLPEAVEEGYVEDISIAMCNHIREKGGTPFIEGLVKSNISEPLAIRLLAWYNKHRESDFENAVSDLGEPEFSTYDVEESDCVINESLVAVPMTYEYKVHKLSGNEGEEEVRKIVSRMVDEANTEKLTMLKTAIHAWRPRLRIHENYPTNSFEEFFKIDGIGLILDEFDAYLSASKEDRFSKLLHD